MDKKRKVTFDEPYPSLPADDQLLVVVKEGAGENLRQRKRSRAASKLSMQSDTSEEGGDQSHVRTDSVVSFVAYRLKKLCTFVFRFNT